MSRSYKKHPNVNDLNTESKRFASRRFRRTNKNENLPKKGNYHRKCAESWEIRDYNHSMTFEEFYKLSMDFYSETGFWYGSGGRTTAPPTKKDVFRVWYKIFKRK